MGEFSVVDRLLVEGLVDWLDPGWVRTEASDSGVHLDEDLRAMTLGAIAALLLGGPAEAGDIKDEGFVAWDCGPGADLERIARGLAGVPVRE